MGIGRGGQYAWGGWMGTLEYVDPEEELFFTFMSQKLPLLAQPTGKIKDLVYQAIID
jgi:CubicO group peptidase (beta-lactamase class C family)